MVRQAVPGPGKARARVIAVAMPSLHATGHLHGNPWQIRPATRPSNNPPDELMKTAVLVMSAYRLWICRTGQVCRCSCLRQGLRQILKVCCAAKSAKAPNAWQAGKPCQNAKCAYKPLRIPLTILVSQAARVVHRLVGSPLFQHIFIRKNDMQTSSFKPAAATALALSALLALGACGKKEDPAATTTPSTPAVTTPAPETTPPATSSGSMGSTTTDTTSMGSTSSGMTSPTSSMGATTSSSTLSSPNGTVPSPAASAGGTQ